MSKVIFEIQVEIDEKCSMKKHYRPYIWEDRNLLRGKWYKLKGKNKSIMVTSLETSDVGVLLINGISSKSFLKNYIWDNEDLNAPHICGIEVEIPGPSLDDLYSKRQQYIFNKIIELNVSKLKKEYNDIESCLADISSHQAFWTTREQIFDSVTSFDDRISFSTLYNDLVFLESCGLIKSKKLCGPKNKTGYFVTTFKMVDE